MSEIQYYIISILLVIEVEELQIVCNTKRCYKTHHGPLQLDFSNCNGVTYCISNKYYSITK